MTTSYVEYSHKRCKEMGVPFDRIYSDKIITDQELQKRLEDNKNLILTAGPYMDQLYNFVKGSGFFAMLTDAEGCILNIIGDENILSEAFSLKMIPGAFMDEKSIGTNAMGTALAEGYAVQISGKEHYVTAYHRWTCSGAPIRGSKGQLIGSLDLTGYSEYVHSHTLGMVVAAANAIEKMLMIEEYSSKLILAKNRVETIVESISAGILTTDITGKILTINKYTMNMFGMSKKEIMNKNIEELFDGLDRVRQVIQSGNNFLEEDVHVNTNTNKLHFTLSAYPIVDERGLKEIIFEFKEIKKGRKQADRIIGSKAIYTFDKIIGCSTRFLEIVEYAKKISDSKSTILITGESGTGKEVFAQAIHNHSSRKESPFVAINCGAIPSNLIESELFGYEEGAFTGAKKGGAAGKFEIADGGTILLDEIGEMPVDMQTKLLRVIEEGVINRVGSNKQKPIDVRIIAATNRELSIGVEDGTFRLDLYYRLNVLPIRLPSLRERKEDIVPIAQYFIKVISKRLNKKEVEICSEIVKELQSYHWPGNIRELENVIERIINTQSVPKHVGDNKVSLDTLEEIEECLDLEQVEKVFIQKALSKYEGNITLAARKLGIGRNTLYRKMGKHKIKCS